ncbi:MAG: SDR family oxidoreductase [Acidobacteria bacterium]|nr:SDR family oxidoreductase [Acidobacteriota bacterium]
MSRYVVTGGAGFIGSALVRSLLREQGAEVAVIDNYLTGSPANLDEIRHRIRIHEIDVRDLRDVSRAVAGADVVYHLAAIPSVPRSIEEPVPSHEVNINGTFNVFHACVENKVRRVVYAASSSAYGDTPALPKTESMLARPKSPYAVQKLIGEYYAAAFHECYGLEAIALRFFNVYGPRQDPTSAYSGVISVFMKCLIEGVSPAIHGDGLQTRDFTFVEDMAALCRKAAAAPASACGRFYNAGNGNRYTLNEVWTTLNRIEGTALQARYGPARPGDVRESQADTTDAVKILGHAPKYSLEEGLRQTLDWYKTSLVAVSC